jgi:hypothetical protein
MFGNSTTLLANQKLFVQPDAVIFHSGVFINLFMLNKINSLYYFLVACWLLNWQGVLLFSSTLMHH